MYKQDVFSHVRISVFSSYVQGGICGGEGGDFPHHCFMKFPAVVGR